MPKQAVRTVLIGVLSFRVPVQFSWLHPFGVNQPPSKGDLSGIEATLDQISPKQAVQENRTIEADLLCFRDPALFSWLHPFWAG